MRKLFAALLMLLLLAGAVHADDTPFGDLDPEDKELADRLKIAGKRPLQIVLYIVSGFGGLVGSIFLVRNGYGWIKAKNPTEKVQYEEHLKNIFIGTLVIIFGPLILATFAG